MVDASLYIPIYFIVVTLFTLGVASKIKTKSASQILEYGNTSAIAGTLLFSLIIAVFLGSRPPTYYFGDTGNYAHHFYLIKDGLIPNIPSSEWLWIKLITICTKITDVNGFLTIVAIGYLGFTATACAKIAPRHSLALLLFNMGAYSFIGYGVNGLRNGLACSIMLLVIALAIQDRPKRLLAIAIAVLASCVHKTVILPLSMLVISLYFIRNFKTAYIFWIFSIILSLTVGGTISSFFGLLGFDDRLSYLTNEVNAEKFSHTGFRFDFLLYSMMPIILGYHIIIKKGLRNRAYEILLNTYTLSNAFWVIVIRAEFSNRFAYLSWFLYPIVLAYPALKMNVWGKKQGIVAAKILMAQLGFTLFMEFIVS